MKFIVASKSSALTAACVLLGSMLVTAAEAMPFSASLRAGFNRESLVTVGTLDFEVAEGDGSVRNFDYLKALGDGSVRKSGDGSVRSCDGSVMPADGACAAPLELGSFSFGGSFDTDPFINFVLQTLNFTDKPLVFDFTFTTPFLGGPYNTLSTDLTGAGNAGGILMQGLVDASVVPAVSIVCATPVGCADPQTTLSSPTNANGLLGARITYTMQPGSNSPVTFDGSVVLSQVNPPAVPEPTTLALFALGVLGAGQVRRRSMH